MTSGEASSKTGRRSILEVNPKMEEASEKRVDLEFSPDVKAAFLRLLPLRTISCLCGFLTSTDGVKTVDTHIEITKLFVEPELKTNRPRKLLHPEPPTERFYEPKGTGLLLKKGDEVAAFRMGSAVVLIFQTLRSRSENRGASSEFRFCINRGDRIPVGQAIGSLHSSS